MQAAAERFAKLTVVAWTGAALAAEAWLLQSWRVLPIITLVAAVAAFLAGRFDRRSVAGVLVLAYVCPALIGELRGVAFAPDNVVWMAALFAVTLPRRLNAGWHMPRPWRGALVFTALAAIVSAMIVIWRESDGVVALLVDPDAMSWRGGDSPPFVAMWTLHVALVIVLGVLWFDWLFGAEVDFERIVAVPLMLSALATAALAAWQLFGDMRFVNPTVFAARGRTTGAIYDANVLGILSALWIGGAFLCAGRLRGWPRYAAAVTMIASAIAVWGSGSKSALVAAVLITLVIPVSMRGTWLRSRRAALGAALALGTVTVAVVVGVGYASSRAGNPAARMWRDVIAATSDRSLAAELWDRNGFGSAATSLIRSFPLAGVGIGRFYSFVTAFPRTDGRGLLPPDNAQNWLRHQIAELGFAGALGWIVWCVGFAAFVVLPRADDGCGAGVARAMLITFGLVSLFGTPGQDLMVTITFWAIAFWYVRLSGTSGTVTIHAATGIGARPPHVSTWPAGALLLCVFAVASTASAADDLRIPMRARRAGAPFSYGFAAPDTAGATDGYRVTNTRAAALVDAGGPWMAVTVRLDAEQPIEVRIRTNDEIVLKATLTPSAPVTAFAPTGTARAPVLLESSANPLGAWWTAATARDIGLRVKWTFVSRTPPGTAGYGALPTR